MGKWEFYQEIRRTTCLVTHSRSDSLEKKVKNVSGYRLVFSIEPSADKIHLLGPTTRPRENTAIMMWAIKFLWVHIFLQNAKT